MIPASTVFTNDMQFITVVNVVNALSSSAPAPPGLWADLRPSGDSHRSAPRHADNHLQGHLLRLLEGLGTIICSHAAPAEGFSGCVGVVVPMPVHKLGFTFQRCHCSAPVCSDLDQTGRRPVILDQHVNDPPEVRVSRRRACQVGPNSVFSPLDHVSTIPDKPRPSRAVPKKSDE